MKPGKIKLKKSGKAVKTGKKPGPPGMRYIIIYSSPCEVVMFAFSTSTYIRVLTSFVTRQ
jgi:hypothetical protein